MELNNYGLGSNGGAHDMVKNFKLEESNLEVLPSIASTLRRKEPEFLDHVSQSIIQPDYIREPGNFLIDFIDHPVVFSKNVVHMSSTVAPTNANTNHFEPKDDLSSDLHFNNSIFHFVNKHGQLQTNETAMVVTTDATDGVFRPFAVPAPPPPPLDMSTVSSTNVVDPTYVHKHTTDFISLNGDFLEAGHNTHKSAYCRNPNDNTGGTSNSQQFPGLALLTDSHVTMVDPNSVMEDDDLLYDRAIERKILPHKKRISRKLREPQCDIEPPMTQAPPPMESPVVLPESRLTVVTTVFSCELCGHSSSSQIEFFAHLKQHYEPNNPDETILSLKMASKQCNNMCPSAVKKETGRHVSHVNNVFNDIGLHYQDFQNIEPSVPVTEVLQTHHRGDHDVRTNVAGSEAVMHTVHHRGHHVPDSVSVAVSEVLQVMHQNQHNEMKILNSNSLDKCIRYVTEAEVPMMKSLKPEEVEFSDPEDMLEGIRNVVDKVSIEDTCDDIDFMAANGMREQWNPAANFSSMASTSLVQLLQTDNSNPVDGNVVVTGNHKGDTQVLAYASQPSNKEQIIERVTFVPSPIPASHADDLLIIQNMANVPTEVVTMPPIIDQANPKSPIGELVIDSEKPTKGKRVRRSTRKKKGIANSLNENNPPNDPDIDGDVGGGDTTQLSNASSKLAEPTSEVLLDVHGKKRFFCTKCNREFNSFNALKYHLRTHTGERNHQCEVCGMKFYAYSALKLHLHKHTGAKPFSCDVCQRNFRQYSDLKYHVISKHTDEKNHQCEFCGKAFSRKYSLVLHRSIHTNDRKYKCEFCEKSFRASVYLQCHRRIHTGEKPFPCEVCGKKFRVSNDMRRHLKIHTRKDEKKQSGKQGGKGNAKKSASATINNLFQTSDASTKA